MLASKDFRQPPVVCFAFRKSVVQCIIFKPFIADLDSQVHKGINKRDQEPLGPQMPRSRPASCRALSERGALARPQRHRTYAQRRRRRNPTSACLLGPRSCFGRAPGTARTQPICGSSLWRRCAAATTKTAARCRQPQTSSRPSKAGPWGATASR